LRRGYKGEALAKPLWGVCKREVRIQKTGVRIIVHVARERVPILNAEFWLLNTAFAEPTKEVLQAPQRYKTLFVEAGGYNGLTTGRQYRMILIWKP